MRVLFINHPESDYGGAFLYEGLCLALGAQNVHDYPSKPSYHGETHTYSLPNIPNGITCCSPWQMNFTSAWEGCADVDAAVRDALRSRTFDLIVAESLRARVLQTFDELAGLIDNTPVIAQDGEDFSEIQYPALRRIRARVLLKREVPRSSHGRKEHLRCGFDCALRDGDITILPFPFSCPRKTVERADAQLSSAQTQNGKFDYDATFLCGATWPDRQQMIDTLRAVNNARVCAAISPDTARSNPQSLYCWDDYIKIMTRSKLNISLRGFGLDTVRYWEAAACGLLCAGPLDLAIPFEFTSGENCLTFDTPAEAVELIAQWTCAERVEQFAAVRDGCLRHLRQHHTCEARARWLLNQLGGLL